ncbi:molecular chaperone DnaK [Kitasatospora gansuensis]|uniref:Molecular chaperone DnaK n=2 Tax=Kitasatospora TaxID=2063 RepID=A0A7W7S6Q6_9ACTN|nr:Hsp70 family protein [Kitasatospora gansuensis]MBB4944930.1 molecular chaperone DnaK [Kitasatospora gansuensis]
MANRALIIANGTYDDDHFAPLPAAAADATQLEAVLSDPDIGEFEVETLVDVGQRAAMRALESFFTRAGRDDLLLLHLSLHGWKDLRNRLYFVMRDTERDYPGATAVLAETVGGFMGESRSRRIVVLLDCCYSGAFSLNALRRDAGTPTVDIAEPFAGNGRVVLTASTALQYAHEGVQDVRFSRTPAQPSVFTSAVVRGLRDGSADLDGDGFVSVDELYEYVHEEVRRSIAGQTPTLSVDSAQGTIHLARSPRHGDVDRLAELRAAVLDVQPWKRIGALHLVEQLLGSVREPTRDTARAALLGLIADEDREVARRARQLWHDRGLGEIPTARPTRPSAPHRPPDTSGPVVGIDFGTTNSSIAMLAGEDVRLIPNAEGALTTPSVVAVTADGEILVGTAARRQAIANPESTVRSVKLRLGTEWTIAPGGVRMTAEDVAGHILRRLREDVEAYTGQSPRLAVMTVPANFDLVQRAALVETANRAGLNVMRVLNEPTAAALTYGLSRVEDASVLVFDLGGGTLDVTLLEIGDGVVEVKATCGDTHLGGDDWDQRIVRHLLRRVLDDHGVDLTGDVLARERLQQAAEAAKIELSSASSTTIRLPYLTSVADTPVHLDETLTRSEFEAMTRDLLERCSRPVEQAIRDAGIRHSELDQVILTGGATRMPAIGELLRRLTGDRQPYRGIIPEGIVTGAALQAGVLGGAVKDVLLLDVLSTSLGFETHDGTVRKLIERNTTIPVRRWAFAAPSRSGQPAMTVHIVEGESPTAADGRTLAVLELSDLPRHPRHTPLIEVMLDIDANQLLHVSVRELRGRTRELPKRARELTEARAALDFSGVHFASPEAGRLRATIARLEAKYFTDRTWQVTVDRASMTQAAELLRSPRWPAVRELAPFVWEAPET